MATSHRVFRLYLVLTGIVFLLFIYTVTKLLPLSINHVVYYCQKSIEHTILSLSHPFPNAIMLIFSIALIVGFSLFCIYIVRTKNFTNSLLKNKYNPSNLQIDTKILNTIDFIESKDEISFCYGVISPRICISSALVSSLSIDELKAVLLHEYTHLQNKDPLKILLLKSITSMFFFIPILKDIQNYFMLAKEIDADQMVMADINNKPYLKSALTKILGSSLNKFNIANFSESTILEQRILIASGYKKKVTFRASSQSIIVSLLSILLFFTFIKSPLVISEPNSTKYEYFCQQDLQN